MLDGNEKTNMKGITQVETFKNKFGLRAIAINSDNGGCTADIMNVSNVYR